MTQSQELTIDRDPGKAIDGGRARTGQRAARSSLRSQVARLERELSAIVAGGFPYIPAPHPAGETTVGPRLLSLGELERSRDELAERVQHFRRLALQRAEHERAAHELLSQMQLEPARHRFVRLSVNDLGQGGCGVWEVRPRLGLIGMLAGWWHVKLSSGCPLAKGSRSERDPARWSPPRVAVGLEVCPRVPGGLLEGALGCAALSPVAVLRGEHLADLVKLEFRFPLRGAGGLPVEQLLRSTAVEVRTRDRDDQQAQRNSNRHHEEVGLRHRLQAPAGAGRVFGRARAARSLLGAVTGSSSTTISSVSS